MTRLFLFLLVSIIPLLAFDSVDVLDPNIKVSKSGWFKSYEKLSVEQALSRIEKQGLNPLPQKVMSFGFDTAEYWFEFELTEESMDPHFFLDIRDPLLESCELFVFRDGKLVRHESSGYAMPVERRPIQKLPIRFKLENSNQKIIYLLKTYSQYPRYPSFAFGVQDEVDSAWNIQYSISIFSFGVFAALWIYNAFLYAMTKDRAYVFYCIYMFRLFSITVIAQGYVHLLPSILLASSPLLVSFFLQIEMIGLVLFTEYFLRLKETDPLWRLKIRYLLYLNIIAALLIPIAKGLQIVSLLSMGGIFIGLIYTAGRSFLRGFKPALYYLIATGTVLISTIFYALMNQGVWLAFNVYSFNLMTFGMVWDLTLLSFALAYRIRLLQEDNIQQERLLIIRSRQDSIGELVGNIAHQWRSPIGELGAIITKIQAKLLYSEISKVELMESILQSSSIIRYMSDTIDTFQSFFQNSPNDENFEVNEQTDRVIELLVDSLQNNGIKVEFVHCEQCIVAGKDNEFAQALINILLNAKDALIDRGVQEKKINIHCRQDKSCAVIEVVDNAGGIDIRPIEKVFEPYITDKTGGTGVGLFIAKTIFEQKLGGKIIANNTDGGAKFEVQLPCIN